jgi:hypothetical protein
MRTETTFVEARPQDGLLKSQLARHANLAAANGQQPFVYAWSEVLPPSVAIDESLNSWRMRRAFAGTYIIRLNVHDWGTPETEELLAGSGIEVNWCPMFFAIDADGTATGRKMGGEAWGANLPRKMARPLKKFFRGK